jgi:hypothetical protein
MKMKALLASAIALSFTSSIVTAQDSPGGRGPGGRPGSPIMAALDANKDGEIDATELANATTALKALDKDGDGKLAGDEIRPPRRRGGPDGHGGRGEKRGSGPDGGKRADGTEGGNKRAE